MGYPCSASGFMLGLPRLSAWTTVYSVVACCVVYPPPCAVGEAGLEAIRGILMSAQLIFQLLALFLLCYAPPTKPEGEYSATEMVIADAWHSLWQILLDTTAAGADGMYKLNS